MKTTKFTCFPHNNFIGAKLAARCPTQPFVGNSTRNTNRTLANTTMIYTCNWGYRIPWTTMKKRYTNLDSITTPDWTLQSITCSYNTSSAKWEWFGVDLLAHCEPKMCDRTVDFDVAAERDALAKQATFIINGLVPYTCFYGRKVSAICSNVNEKYDGWKWDYPEGICLGFLQLLLFEQSGFELTFHHA